MSLITKLKFIDDRSGKTILKGVDLDLHGHLTDNADWNAEFWDFHEECLRDYSEKLERLFSQSANGFEFEALWAGDRPTKILNLSLDEFLEVVKKNEIGTKTKYIVRKHA